jgi:hypothetical protein
VKKKSFSLVLMRHKTDVKMYAMYDCTLTFIEKIYALFRCLTNISAEENPKIVGPISSVTNRFVPRSVKHYSHLMAAMNMAHFFELPTALSNLSKAQY